jgi:hypothetical protein
MPVALAATLLLALAAPAAAAMEARVSEIRMIGRTVSASIDLREALSEKLRQVLESGGSLHVRIQTELWEDRPLWDRLVVPATVTLYHIVRNPTTSQIAITSAVGYVTSYAAMPDPLRLRADVGPAENVSDGGHYYLRAIATIGTLAEREVERTGEAVFGEDDGSVSLGRVGRFIFNTVLQATDYLHSVSAEARSRRFEGRELRPGVRQ